MLSLPRRLSEGNSITPPLNSHRLKLLLRLFSSLEREQSALDVGCGDFRTYDDYRPLLGGGIQLHGCDINAPKDVPEGVEFTQVDLESGVLPYDDDQYDLLIFSHVIEHVSNPVQLFGELIRVLKPGGHLYIETPSDRSLTATPWFPQHWNLILSYYDDPTHIGRPWSPQALRRLALYYGCEPLVVRRDFSMRKLVSLPFDWIYGIIRKSPDHLVDSWWRAVGWVTYGVVRKPHDSNGAPEFVYYTFKGRPIGPKFEFDMKA